METGNQSVVHYDAGPKQLMFGPHGAGQQQAPSPKKLAQRVVNPAPIDSPDMDQKRFVGEVHRLFEQDKQDAGHFESVKDTLNDHANWLKLLKALSYEIQEKVSAVTVQAVDNDTSLKKSIAMTDAELKEKLRLLEMIVTKQGSDVKEMNNRKLDEQLTSGFQALDAKYGQAVAALEGAVRGLREEMPARFTEMAAAVANMGESVTGRLNAVETEVTLQASVSATAPGIDPQAYQAGAAAAPAALAFPQCAVPPQAHTSVPVSATAPYQSPSFPQSGMGMRTGMYHPYWAALLG